MLRGINPTVPDMLGANMQVSDARLFSELRSMDRTLRHYGSQHLAQILQLDSTFPDNMIPSEKKRLGFAEERRMVIRAIDARLEQMPLGLADVQLLARFE